MRVKKNVLFQFADFGGIEDVGLGLRWSPADFASEVANRAAALAAENVAAGSTVVIAHSGSARFFADLFAVWALGCTAACIDAALTENEVENLIGFVEPSAVLVDKIAPGSRTDVPVFQLATVAHSRNSIRDQTGDLNRPALILFTSGTTGNPKGVVLSFRALLNRIALNKAAMGSASEMRALVTLPTSFGHGLIGNALTPLLSGGDIVLHPLGLPLAQNLGKIIDQYRIGFLSSVPAFWRMALKFSDAPAEGTLARIHIGSAPLSADLWAKIVEWSRANVVNCYGVTELANWVAGASSRVDNIADGLVGKPWGGEAAVKNSAGAIRTAGEGELLVRSPSVMSGYLRRPDLTAEVMVDGWYQTGDTAHIDERGLIRLTGRIKDEINRAGLKVQPAEIDALLETHPAVAEACVFGVADAASGEIVAAAVRPAADENVSAEALAQWCATRLRREAIPERWFVVDKLPRNERGKINRDAVRRLLIGDSE
jgi:acyl-CoA synthetase (AMP-forming)/AMP-acid ligase II